MKSEDSQKIYNSLQNSIKTPFGNRCMEELGVIRGLEKNKLKNYILIAGRTKDDKGQEYTTHWEIHEIHDEENVKFRLNEDANEFIGGKKQTHKLKEI